MKKTKLFTTVGMGLLTLALASPVALAKETQTKTDATTNFVADEEGTTPPIDPENPDPENPIIPDEPDPGKTEGALRLDHVSNINFGTNLINSKGQNYFAEFSTGKPAGETESVKMASFVQLTDDRGGAKGWKISVDSDGTFVSDKDPKDTFKAAITFSNIGVNSGSGLAADLAPTVKADDLVITEAGVGTDIITSAADKGAGIWSFPIGTVTKQTTGYGKEGLDPTGDKVEPTKEGRNPAIKLTTTNGTIVNPAATYTAEINWSLDDTI